MTHDKNINRLLFNWLTLNMLLIFFMIIIGGLTRLTNSGLSITEWELFKGILPPLNDLTWDNYFNSYKKIPQFELINPSMTLDEFKIIFYWEYFHRMMGRIIGICFLLPLLYFHIFKKIELKKLISYYGILLLIIFQGFIGWYMVQSGLVNDVTVSHYRLSLHLTMAILIISIIFWEILNLRGKKKSFFLNNTSIKLPFIFLIVLIFFQIIFGAFVSGLDAGKIYQTWPLMGNNYFPNDLKVINLANMTDLKSHSLVQFYHRNLAYIITFYILLISFFIFKYKHASLYRPLTFFLLILLLQIVLGVFTLLSNLHMLLALGHQISGVLLVLSSLNLYYSVIK